MYLETNINAIKLKTQSHLSLENSRPRLSAVDRMAVKIKGRVREWRNESPTHIHTWLFRTEFTMQGWSWAVDSFLWKYQSMQIKAVIRKRDRLKDERRPDHLISRTHIFPSCSTALVASTGELQCGIVVGLRFAMSIKRHLILSWTYDNQNVRLPGPMGIIPKRHNGLLYDYRFLCCRSYLCILSNCIDVLMMDHIHIHKCEGDALNYQFYPCNLNPPVKQLN